MNRSLCVVVVFLAGLVGPCGAQIIDHTDIARVQKLPQSVMDAVGRQKWFFSHASVGGNMVDGLNDLRSSDSTRYQLQVSSVGYNSSALRANNPPSPTLAGRVYECQRGNPGWSAKFTIFDNSVRVAGWRWSAVDAAMDKLCYIDQSASATSYTTTMAALEMAYPDTVLVYTTMPLMSTSDSDNVLRNQYNAAVRQYCVMNKKLLYDIADIEAYDPSGTQQTFSSGGQTYQKLYNGYTDDGGHLNSTGRQRVAMGWYAAAAAIVPMGINNRAARDPIFATAGRKYRFAAWGSVTVTGVNSFTLDDGSGRPVNVTAAGHGLANGDRARAAGVLDNSTNPPTLQSCARNVRKLN